MEIAVDNAHEDLNCVLSPFNNFYHIVFMNPSTPCEEFRHNHVFWLELLCLHFNRIFVKSLNEESISLIKHTKKSSESFHCRGFRFEGFAWFSYRVLCRFRLPFHRELWKHQMTQIANTHDSEEIKSHSTRYPVLKKNCKRRKNFKCCSDQLLNISELRTC